MPRNPKCHVNGSAVFITASVQEGLPLVATPYMELIIEGILAAAQTRYPVTLCAYCFMANHFHILLVVQNPADVSNFMRYLKGELSHAINRLLGRKQRTVWIAGYDSPVFLTHNKAWEKLNYIYINPVEGDLVERAAQYPGVTSYQALLHGGMKKTCRRVSRDAIPALPNRSLSLREQAALAERLREADGADYTLIVEPWAFLHCFEHGESLDIAEQTEQLLKQIKQKEDHLKRERKSAVVGVHALRLADPRRPYVSERNGKMTVCLSDDVSLRKSFIEWFKSERDRARASYRAFRAGLAALSPPPGFFAPGGASKASLFTPFFLGILY